jgi:oligopeptide/dipeptide ABC transporter ATP-binding protein
MDERQGRTGGGPLLEVRELRTWFSAEAGTARAVDGVSFHVDPGETLGIVGESGCGKTVTALSILGLVPRPAGRILEESSIRFRGRELTTLPERELRRVRGNEIAMIFQEPMTSLNPVFSVGEQIGESLRMHRGMNRREAREEGIAALREVGIPEAGQRFDAYPYQLSGGMRQRVMIAMALSCEPDLLIADEPTTALDVTIQAQILDLLAAVRTRRGMAMLLITHDLGVVAEVCDRVLVMYAGQVVEAGTVADIFHHPRHPYTRGLLASLPRIDNAGRRLHPIEGTVPSPVNWPSGCRFHDRCSHAWARCVTDPPDLLPAEGETPGRSSRCWLEKEPERWVAARGTPG